MVVPTSEAVVPEPAVGVPDTVAGGPGGGRGGGHRVFGPLSFSNRYTVRPAESTRIRPRAVFAVPIEAGCPLSVFGALFVGVASALLSLLPQPDSVTAARAATASAVKERREVRGLIV